MMRWLLRLTVVAAIVVIAAAGTLGWVWSRLEAPGPGATAVTVVIPKGTNTHGIGEQLAKAGAVSDSRLFMAEVYLSGTLSGERGLKAGEYAIPTGATMAAIIDMMHRGLVVVHKLTIPEGYTVVQVMALLRDARDLTGDVSPPPEGSLLPETYQYLLGDERGMVLARTRRAMTATLDELWANRALDLPIATEHDALVLASIVERETGLAAERPHVASVFENRLKLGMKLESDPTVIYVLSHGAGSLDRSLTHDDMSTPSPYNTYANTGLPPEPICNPGRASLEAVLHPMASDDLYFVADGSGGHAFAKTKDEHDKNVAHWRQIVKARQTAQAAAKRPGQ